ncbi:MAG: heme exporter protein CcmB, partial [Anaerolineales bacterium]|nr:heme exporter protein CcmB [Anaerolineales bacterium]
AIFFGKMISNLAFMLAVEVVTLPIYSFLYNMNLFRPGFLLVILLGSIGYAGAGTLLASMAVQTRTRDALLPILLFPVIIPLLLALMRASGGYLQGLTTSDVRVWLNLILVYDVVFLTVAYMVFGFVVEE